MKQKFKHHVHRNAVPRAEAETPLERVGYTAGGAVASAFLGGYLAKQGWPPKTIASALALLGAGLSWQGETALVKNIGSGVMASSGGQLVREMFGNGEVKREAPQLANARALGPGELAGAFERVRKRLAMQAA